MSNQHRIGLYARVSTLDKGQDTSVQLSQLYRFCAMQGWGTWNDSLALHGGVPGHVIQPYVEQKSAVKHRPVLYAMLRDCQERRLDTVCVWKLDRFARSIKDFVITLTMLDSLRVRFICTSQGIDTDRNNPVSRFAMHIMAAAAELEHSLIKERVVAGIQRAREKGIELGRPRQVLDVDAAIRLQDNGYSLTQIAMMLDLKLSPQTIMRRIAARRGSQEVI